MSIVSISEASRLVNKSRKTIYKHIQQGKLSTITTVDDFKGVDTSELIRVYGILKIQKETPITTGYSKQIYTQSDTKKEIPVTVNNPKFTDLEKDLALSKLKIEQQEKELNYKQKIIDAKDDALSSKQETIDTLKSALKLLEYKQEKHDTIIPNKNSFPPSEPQKNDTPVENIKPSGFWSGFKRIFK